MFIHSDVLMHFLTQKKINYITLISFQQFGQKCMEAVPWCWLNFHYYWDVLFNITSGSVTCLIPKTYILFFVSHNEINSSIILKPAGCLMSQLAT